MIIKTIMISMSLISVQKFSCDDSSTNYFKTDSIYCPDNSEKVEENGVAGEVEKFNLTNLDHSAERGLKSLSIKSKDASVENGKLVYFL